MADADMVKFPRQPVRIDRLFLFVIEILDLKGAMSCIFASKSFLKSLYFAEKTGHFPLATEIYAKITFRR